MTTINQLLVSKGSDIYFVSPTQSVYEAIAVMAERDIGSLLVMEGDMLVGIFTERQYTRNVILKGRTSPQTRVHDIMEPNVVVIEPDDTVEWCMALMTKKRVRHLPVLDDGRVVGIVSIGDLVKAIIDDKRFIIDQLETYIHGERVKH